MKKMVVVVMAVALSIAASGIGLVGKSRGARLGEGKRLGATMVDRSKPRASTNAVVVADGVWKENPGGLFGKKFGEMIPAKVVLSGGRGERSVTFQPEKRFRKFSNYRQLVDPRTRIVYGLTCSAKFKNEDEANAEVAAVKDILGQKFPKARTLVSPFRIGYGEGGDGGSLGLHWTIALTVVAPKSNGQMLAEYEVWIRAIDDHFFPQERTESTVSSDMDAL